MTGWQKQTPKNISENYPFKTDRYKQNGIFHFLHLNLFFCLQCLKFNFLQFDFDKKNLVQWERAFTISVVNDLLSNDFSFLCASPVQFIFHLHILVVTVTQELFLKQAINFQLAF